MLILMAITSPANFFFSPPEKTPRYSCPKFKDAFFSIKHYSSSYLISPRFHRYYTLVPVSALQSVGKENRSTTDWNSKICAFCEMGNLKNAVELLYMSRRTKLEPSAYCSLLQLCAELRSLKDGELVHSIICSNGVPIRGVLGSKIVFMYVTCGNLINARMVFDEIENDKVFLWNLMINGYAKIGDFRESVHLFTNMVDLGIEVDSHTLSCVLKCFAALGSVMEGECVHGYLLKLGFGSSTAVVNSLLAFYLKIRRIDSARKLFDEISERDVISWNSLINGYVANGFSHKGLELFLEMLSSEVSVDLATVLGVLAACALTSDTSLGRAVHAFALKTGFSMEVAFCNTLLDMYSKGGDLNSATQVFKKMDETSVVSWTCLLAGHAREGLSAEAIRLFHEMVREGIRPDPVTITTVLHACAGSKSLEDGKNIHNYMRECNLPLTAFICNALMDMYAKCGSMEDAKSVFLEMPVKDIISWNTIIGGYARNGFPNEALSLFGEMVKESKPDGRTLACVLPACAILAAIDRGREIHGYSVRKGIFSDQHVANALIDMYAKCGALVLAVSLFHMVPKDLITWTVMIAGFAMHGLGKDAMNALKEMRQTGIKPNEVSFGSILHACSLSGLTNEGWKLFRIMQNECNIKPNLEHYACMVDLLARLGKLERAYKFIETMPIEPDPTVWGALLNGCRIHYDVKLAEKVAEHIFTLEPDNSRYYILLANVYAEAEKWEQVKKLSAKIGQKGLRKNPKCSWIDIKGKVHIFVSRDRSYPLAKKIESLLQGLRSKMMQQLCLPETRYGLINPSDKDKGVARCGHSEKVAIAYGVLTLPPGKTIRVTKNSRVCGDCHETARFMSETFDRSIILRDSSRFHHFKDGNCSCRGFW